MNYYTRAIKKYTEFGGRASRAEYWYFFLFNLIIVLVLKLIIASLGTSSDGSTTLTNLYSLFIFLPATAVAIRRMHDINKSGWFSIIPIYNIILLAQKGDEGVNKYGNAPQKNTSEVYNSNKSNGEKSTEYCSNCGGLINNDSKFCVKCGNKIK